MRIPEEPLASLTWGFQVLLFPIEFAAFFCGMCLCAHLGQAQLWIPSWKMEA